MNIICGERTMPLTPERREALLGYVALVESVLGRHVHCDGALR
jgi:hypothetical protein